ncbi:MAG TPA: hypothetical protein VJU86_08000 [Pyrinomonadaceae bacterium]|nr:hypothetical protein [Pyrinomonadaceae bacterium]
MKPRGPIFFCLAIINISACWALGQTVETKPAPATPVPAATPRPNVDEIFELNIDLRQVTRENFEASTAVSTSGESNLNVQVGVGVATGRIEFLLRNVQGRIRFRGSLERIFEIIDGRRAPVTSPR